MYLKIFIFSILVFIMPLKGQDRIISGLVADSDTDEPIEFCNIVIKNTTKGTLTNSEGLFSISVSNAGKVILIISSIGYNADTLNLTTSSNFYTIKLKANQQALNEVVITGVARASYVRETPMTIVSIPARTIERSLESNIIDALTSNVPGLTAVKTGPNISKPYIRGLGYNRVLILYDGIRQEGQQWGDEHGVELDGYNVGNAEVIKGPASLMYGSDALAGVVSILPSTQKDNDTSLRGNFVSEYQSNNALIGNGFKFGQTSIHWQWFVSGSFKMAKNYTNSIDGRVYNTGFREQNLSGTLGHQSKNGFSNINLTYYNNIQGIPDGSRDSMTRRFTRQVFEPEHDNVNSRPIVSDQELNSYDISPLHQHIQHYRVYSNNNYRVGSGAVELLLAFQQNLRKEFNHPVQVLQPGMSVRLNTLNYGFRYNAPAILNFETTLGVNGMYQSNTNYNATDFPIPDYYLLDVGTYGIFKWKYNQWTLSGGARFDSRSLNAPNFYVKNNPLTGFSQKVNLPDTAAYLQFPAFQHKFNGLSMSMGLTYMLNSHLYVKANVARAFRAPSITELASNGLDPGAHIVYIGNKNFNPEFSFQQDIGVNAYYENFTAVVSFFNNNIENYIYLAQKVNANGTPVEIVPGNKTFQYQQSTAQLYGFETSLNIQPKVLKGFSFSNSMAFTNGYNRKSEYKNTGIKGEYLPLIPPFKVLNTLNQEIKLNNKIIKILNVKVEVDYNAHQTRYLSLYNTETYTPGYTLINTGAGFEVNYFKKYRLIVQIQINNLFNTVYQSNLSRLKYFEYYQQSPNGHLGIFNMGRNICFKVILPL